MPRLGSYSRTLDEIFAMSAPKPKPRQSTGSNSAVTTADSKGEINRSPLVALGDRPTTRHGRSSESSSSSNKTENKSEVSDSTRTRVDVWTREDNPQDVPHVDAVELLQALGSKRRNIADSPIMENELSEISSASSEASTSSENQIQPFTQTRSLRTASSSNPTTSDSIKIPSIHTAPSTSSSNSSGKESRKSSITETRELQKENDGKDRLNGVNLGNNRPTTFTKDKEDEVGTLCYTRLDDT
ncbi:unnamed protein product [Bursaphelenchus xylophilus]|uniref:(pine wood nematode) hypothetical protein n=1 Tax=Bursaphelenchus xylophilus TaxID=6326 RepID=A0A1I7S4U6_BURXY|nr:unnamed protein product [Bursaphelenchus xylophilus]CAG9117386.1 unnamed protein product [Bursaphelenchus xylophilus]